MKRCVFFLILLSAINAYPQDNYSRQRERMVETQIAQRGVTDERVLAAMKKIPRHKFVPIYLRGFAHRDSPLPIGYNQTISQPYIVGLMSQLLELRGNEKVLEIGTGSGYQAAVLSLLCREVYTIEILKPLADSARRRLEQLGYHNIEVKHGDGYLGWPQYAPFDAIIVTAAPDQIPPKLVEQLKEGGRMVLPVGKYFQTLKVVRKVKGQIKEENIIPVRFVPMIKSKNKVKPKKKKCPCSE
ncbi:MAG: protein-L-isoaspartate(D-aspartate) O-methyltransferase [Candidatus Omnitrophota bacterium]|nr:MAG: protein-L-isoaspartate(D-aspartate) O-methyltransferase [Candidatus Omnitrophota bacterium]